MNEWINRKQKLFEKWKPQANWCYVHGISMRKWNSWAFTCAPCYQESVYLVCHRIVINLIIIIETILYCTFRYVMTMIELDSTSSIEEIWPKFNRENSKPRIRSQQVSPPYLIHVRLANVLYNGKTVLCQLFYVSGIIREVFAPFGNMSQIEFERRKRWNYPKTHAHTHTSKHTWANLMCF